VQQQHDDAHVCWLQHDIDALDEVLLLRRSADIICGRHCRHLLLLSRSAAAVDACCSLLQSVTNVPRCCTARAAGAAAARWDSGETYLIMDQPMSAVVDKLRKGLSIRTNCPITSITYDSSGAVLTGPAGVRLGARKVIITAPLGVLQAGCIQFSPQLPAAKLAAVSRLRMGNAAKVSTT